jgi:hypothetical protein
MSDDGLFSKSYKIEDNSMPSISEGWIKKDEIRFDEPLGPSEDVPFGSMDLGVDPNEKLKVEPGQTVHPDKENEELRKEINKYKFPVKQTVVAFADPSDKLPEYVDPRLPKEKKKKLKLDVRGDI